MFGNKTNFISARTARITAIAAHRKALMQLCMEQVSSRSLAGFVSCTVALPNSENVPTRNVLSSVCYDLRLLTFTVKETVTDKLIQLELTW